VTVKINKREIGPDHPVYFIADVASNHNGDLARAKELVHACAESGANAVKMQNFTAETIVSDFGFRHLGDVSTHQSKWSESVFESYRAASIPLDWTVELKGLCERLGIDYFTSPYSPELVEAVAPHVSAFKVGSGDITWHEQLELMASFGKPVLLATGASSMREVDMAMDVLLAETDQVVLMQCNTNYTASVNETRAESLGRFKCINLRVLETYSRRWPGLPIGLSDHTHGSLTVLGAVGLFDCSVVEKHFTLDNSQEGQDHSFSMMPAEWKRMVDETATLRELVRGIDGIDGRYAVTREAVNDPVALDLAIGDGVKRVEDNEKNTIFVQRRAVRSTRDLPRGHLLAAADLCVLRPCPADGLAPYELHSLDGRVLNRKIRSGDCVRLKDVDIG
jgi:N-acetylneuraminate synthase